jgi:hypothetical protein
VQALKVRVAEWAKLKVENVLRERISAINLNHYMILAYYDIRFIAQSQCRIAEPRDIFNKTLFSSHPSNERDNVECFIPLGWKGFPVKNTPAYGAH